MNPTEPSPPGGAKLDSSDLLVAEFKYITESAFQANEDRARVSQFFFVTFGTFIAAIFSTQLENVSLETIYTAFAIAFFVVTCLGGLTLLQLARLRAAWFECAWAMNQIKDVAIQAEPALAAYFRWTAQTLPPVFKPNSVGFYLALIVAILGGLTMGSAITFFGLARGATEVPWGWALSGGLLALAALVVFCYWLPLRQPSQPRQSTPAAG